MFEHASEVQDLFGSLLVELETSNFPILGRVWPGRENDILAADNSGAAYVLIREDQKVPTGAVLQRENLQVFSGLDVSLRIDNQVRTGRYTAVKLSAAGQVHLQSFALLAANLVGTLPANPTPSDVALFIDEFGRLFDPTIRPRIRDVLGLWGELYIICSSADCAAMFAGWHAHPNQIFDFALDGINLEVKTCSGSERKHRFSLSQLNTNRESTAVISLHVFEATNGTSIADLVSEIANRVGSAQAGVLLNRVYSVLGTYLESTSDYRYSLRGESGISVLPAKVFPRVTFDPPRGVSAVKFTVEVSELVATHGVAFHDWSPTK
ncbi:PD-(D/E)XK motif protein [Paenarthrobacter ureafaciens]|uniref:PD-(D/E)XK motif protein n=1 Tax=Paenarthrobacter ureafaciens TaxID=37931 RepID=UPI001C2BA036|nr:PD-(D/E)XK motif protein [Paenarthrobacter ureafaciens]